VRACAISSYSRKSSFYDWGPMKHLHVTSGRFAYDVVVGAGAWQALQTVAPDSYSSRFVLTEDGLWKRWGRKFLRESGLRHLRTIFVPAGETSKSVRMAERVAGALLAGAADRRSLLVAFGGGVIGDLGGFVASTYMRGIDYVQAPTTVVAQVDSAIGGKTAVNVGAMKNLLGTFYPPRLVISDPTVLATLDARAFRSGIYEMVKHATLAGERLFGELETHLDSMRPSHAKELGPLIAHAALVKVEVVCADEREVGLRRVLNLGHTFGHAFEEVTHYRRFLHGEAVAWGLLVAARLAERIEILGPHDAARIRSLLRRVGPLPPIDDLTPGGILALLPRDKKAVGGRIHWVLPERVGKMLITAEVPPAQVRAALLDTQRAGQHE